MKLTEAGGKPFIGSAVISVYDKSVEYIAGGSNVGDIRACFWQWRRQHNESTTHTLGRWFANLLKRGEVRMRTLGVFGDTADEEGNAPSLGSFGRGGGMPMVRRAKGRRQWPLAAR